jgi:hypothetical protein
VSTVNTALDPTIVVRTKECCWTPDYLLRHCEGYIVDGPDGHVGFVSELVETDDALELGVEGRCGEIRVPVQSIASLDPHGQRIAITAVPG